MHKGSHFYAPSPTLNCRLSFCWWPLQWVVCGHRHGFSCVSLLTNDEAFLLCPFMVSIVSNAVLLTLGHPFHWGISLVQWNPVHLISSLECESHATYLWSPFFFVIKWVMLCFPIWSFPWRVSVDCNNSVISYWCCIHTSQHPVVFLHGRHTRSHIFFFMAQLVEGLFLSQLNQCSVTSAHYSCLVGKNESDMSLWKYGKVLRRVSEWSGRHRASPSSSLLLVFPRWPPFVQKSVMWNFASIICYLTKILEIASLIT